MRQKETASTAALRGDVEPASERSATSFSGHETHEQYRSRVRTLALVSRFADSGLKFDDTIYFGALATIRIEFL
jgi:hypothetical protein